MNILRNLLIIPTRTHKHKKQIKKRPFNVQENYFSPNAMWALHMRYTISMIWTFIELNSQYNNHIYCNGSICQWWRWRWDVRASEWWKYTYLTFIDVNWSGNSISKINHIRLRSMKGFSLCVCECHLNVAIDIYANLYIFPLDQIQFICRVHEHFDWLDRVQSGKRK